MKRSNTLRAYGALFRVRLAEALQYRLSALSQVAVSVLFGLILCVLYTVFYEHGVQGAAGAFTLARAVSYVWLSQAFYGVLTTNPDADIWTMIVKGNVAMELCRPLDLYGHWYFRTLAGKVGGGLGRFLGTLLVALLLPPALRLGPPASPAGLMTLLPALALGIALANAFTLLLCALRLNVSWGNGPANTALLLAQFLSGFYIPLSLWPEGLRDILRLLPFAGMLDTPLRLYVGDLAPAEALPLLAWSACWTLGFLLLGKWVMRRKLQTIIIQGG